MEMKSILKGAAGVTALATAGYVGYRVGSNAGKLKAGCEAQEILDQKVKEAKEEAEEIAAKKEKQDLMNFMDEYFNKKIKKLIGEETKKSNENKKSESETTNTKEGKKVETKEKK